MDNEPYNAENGISSPSFENKVFISEPRSIDAGEGVGWIADAWRLVKSKLGLWMFINMIIIVIIMLLNIIPPIGILLKIFFTPVMIAGIIAICEHQRKTGEVKIGLLFIGFKQKFIPLIAVGAISFIISFMTILISAIVGGNSIYCMFLELYIYGNISVDTLKTVSNSIIFILIFMIIANTISLSLTWFAPALILNHHFSVGSAIKASLQAVKRNILPGILYFSLIFILMLISIIPFGLGLLITMPLTYCCYYSSYRSLFFIPNNQFERYRTDNARASLIK